jgi:hypothetical protein
MHDTLSELVNRKPFRPFLIRLSNGSAYAVSHPESVYLFKTKIVIALPDSNEALVCFLLHIAEVRMAHSFEL